MKRTCTEPLRILIVSKMFPPLGTARSIQIGRVAGALNDADCMVQVVAGLAHSLLDSGCQIGVDDPPKYQIHFVRYPADSQSRGFKRIWRHLMRELESVNAFAAWVNQAAIVSEQVIGTFKPHVLLTSSTPFESHLVGIRLKRRTGIPWVASLSDPWPRQIQPAPYGARKIPLLSVWQMRALRRVLRMCDGVHMPSVYGLRAVERPAEMPIAEKGWAIPHVGVPLSRAEAGGVLPWLVHFGQLTRERVSIALLRAIRLVADTHPDLFKGLFCVGTVCPEFEMQVRSLGLSEHVRVQQQVKTQEAWHIASKAGALLVVEADMVASPFLPSKFADYAFAGRPILALTPAVSQIRDYLRNSLTGVAVAHDTDEIVQALRRIFTNSDHAGHWTGAVDERLAHEFSSQNVGTRYVEMLCACVAKKGPVSPSDHSQPTSTATRYGSRRTL